MRARRSLGWLSVFCSMVLLTACGDGAAPPEPPDGGGGSDASIDASVGDAGRADAGADVGVCGDEDGDGSRSAACGGDDCDDADPSRYPGATEICDGDDEDCDPDTLGADGDGDGYTSSACCDGARCGDDCDDTLNTVNPLASETCDGVDDDCDGMPDDGLLVSGCYSDRDSDGFGAGAASEQCLDMTRVEVGFCPAGYTNLAAPTDCNDARADTSPGATEFCDDVDNDCDGFVDDVAGAGAACTVGVGACAAAGVQACVGVTLSCVGAPGMVTAEVCNGVDDDCDGVVDNGVELLFDCRRDADGDGFGVGDPMTQFPDASRAAFGRCPIGYTNATQLDCDDASAAIRPTATESCNDVDDDCDGVVDDLAPALSALTVSCGALSPAFDPSTAAYRIAAVLGTSSCVVQATVACPSALALSVDGVAATSGVGVAVPLTGFARPMSVQVTASGGATRSYELALVRSSLYFKASNTGVFDSFSGSVALSADGSTLAVGAFLEESPATGVGGDQASDAAESSGAVYVFRRTAGAWAQEAYVKASNTGIGDYFGWSVALSADGTALAVGAYGEDSAATGVGGAQPSDAVPESGAVYVFRRTAGVWAQEAYVKASNTGASDDFGRSVALSADGSVLAVAARLEDSAATGVGGSQTSDAASDSGAVYVFRRTAGVWAQEAYVKASNTGIGDYFGWSVALSADGTVLAVGAYAEASAAMGVGGNQASNSALGSGAVYVFRRAAGVWAQEAYVKASNTGLGDVFGSSVALSADGTTLAVGAREEDSAATGVGGNQASNAASRSGAVYVFRHAASEWSQEAYVKASNTGASDRFGTSVALSADGTLLAVGADWEASASTGIGGDQTSNAVPESGAVYVFRRTAGVWAQEAYVKAPNTGSFDHFGESVALSADGSALAVGAPDEDSAATGIGGDPTNNAAPDSGAVYVF
jgi:phosphopantetheinyl transferase (holo-ACP synthase)